MHVITRARNITPLAVKNLHENSSTKILRYGSQVFLAQAIFVSHLLPSPLQMGSCQMGSCRQYKTTRTVHDNHQQTHRYHYTGPPTDELDESLLM